MKRHAESYLLEWFKRKERMPLIIRGARQVGKSTLVKLFCQSNKIELIEINLEKSKLLSSTQEIFQIQDILDEVQLHSKKKITKNSVLFFDEIQESPKLLKALRYFYEEHPEIAVICAGSLLELALRNDQFSFPVGRVEFYHLGPMNFSEFLLATNNSLLAEKLESLDFSPTVHQLALNELQKFYYVGGMPQAVKTYIETKSLVTIRHIQNQILQTYVADFPKYNPRIQTDRIERIFSACVHQLGKKVIYQKLDQNAKSRDIRKVIELLIDARVLLPCLHTNANTIPLAGESDDSIFKLYFLDIGLINAMMDLDTNTIDFEFKNNFNTKGMLAEQFVAQHLAYQEPQGQPPRLYYWLRDKGSQKGEVDFIIQQKNQVIPIEVKSTSVGHLKSLFYFIKEKNKKLAVKISLDKFSKEKIAHKIEGQVISSQLLSLPQYAIMQLKKLTLQSK